MFLGSDPGRIASGLVSLPGGRDRAPGGAARPRMADYHRQLVRAVLFHQGPASRIEIGSRTGLAPSELTPLCNDLIKRGFVRASRTTAPHGDRAGRKRTVLEVDLERFCVLGLTYDDSYVRVAAVDLAGHLLWSRRQQGRFAKQPVLLAQLGKALKVALAQPWTRSCTLLAVGAADPGLVDRGRGVALRAANIPDWKNVPVVETLSRNLHPRGRVPVLIERADAWQALGEAVFGAGCGARTLLLVTWVSAGVGGGLVESGRLVSGRDGAAGEIGHLNIAPSSPSAPLCGCGLRGCLESEVAPQRLLRAWNRGRVPPRKSDCGPAFLRMLDAAKAGDRKAVRLLDGAAACFALALGSAANLLNPECIVLGGFFQEAGNAFLQALRAEFSSRVMHELGDGMELHPATQGEDAILLGLAAQVRAAVFAYPNPPIG